MTPETFAAIGALVDRYGLPLAIFAGFLWLLLTRRLVLGFELRYVEARRLEERDARLAAEERLKLLTDSLDTIGGSMEKLADTIVDQVEAAMQDDRDDREEARRARNR